jgi:hypothetical protein
LAYSGRGRSEQLQHGKEGGTKETQKHSWGCKLIPKAAEMQLEIVLQLELQADLSVNGQWIEGR